MDMTYKQLQTALKELRDKGKNVSCKLNSSKEVLEAEYGRLTVSKETSKLVNYKLTDKFYLQILKVENINELYSNYDFNFIDTGESLLEPICVKKSFKSFKMLKHYFVFTLTDLLSEVLQGTATSDLHRKWLKSDRASALEKLYQDLKINILEVERVYARSHSGSTTWDVSEDGIKTTGFWFLSTKNNNSWNEIKISPDLTIQDCLDVVSCIK